MKNEKRAHASCHKAAWKIAGGLIHCTSCSNPLQKVVQCFAQQQKLQDNPCYTTCMQFSGVSSQVAEKIAQCDRALKVNNGVKSLCFVFRLVEYGMLGKCSFQDAWLGDPQYSQWIEHSSLNRQAKCKVCMNTFGVSNMARQRSRATYLCTSTPWKYDEFVERAVRIDKTAFKEFNLNNDGLDVFYNQIGSVSTLSNLRKFLILSHG